MAVRSFVLIALAVSTFIVSCTADYSKASSYSVAKASNGNSAASSASAASYTAHSPKKRKCIKVKKCPKNEEFTYCTQSIGRAQYCSQYGQSMRYQDNTPSSCKEGCVCKEDYLRNVNGTCIPAWQCKANCAPSEVLDDCPVDCASDYCPTSNADTSECERPDPDQCPSPVCKCRFNYRRATNGSCIPTDKCPPFDCSCQPNEEYDPCPPYCPTDDCSQATPSGECPKQFGNILIVLQCNPKCRCKKGYWRKDGICVPYRDCPKTCPPYEEYVPCIQGVCRAMYCSQRGEDIPCPDRSWPEEECDAGCICKEHYLRTKVGSCVLENQCDTNICPINEEYSECTQALCRAQNCTQKGKPIACPMITDGSCITGCVCKEGFLRLQNGTCVSEDQCEPPTCEDNEILDNCPTDCRSDYCPTCEEDNERCPKPDPCPAPACKCAFNYRRDVNGKCIPTEDCPPFDCSARPNEQYTPCPPICPSDACGLPRVTGRCPFRIGIRLECNPKCQCEDGYGRSNGTCVPFEECPDLCPKNEEYNSCTQAICRPQNCSERNNPPMFCPAVKEGCEKGCVCKKEYYRNENGTCVTDNECGPLCPYPHEEYKISNKPNCPILDTCTSIVARINCQKPEVPGCICQSGYLRLNETSSCIPICECPQIANTEHCQNMTIN